ncbi:MAG TPA: class II glutamine amidotransferase [Myxococcota bacterium]|nr:class II glutamine amidotransferase [Myxococcota bacterium]
MSPRSTSFSEHIALSFDGQASPAIALSGETEGQPALIPSTWGIGWYPDNQRAAAVLKDPDLPQGTALSGFIERWGQVRSSLFIGHTRGLNQRGSQSDAQPFMKSYAGRQWLFASSGELSPDTRSTLSLDDAFDIAPVGSTPAEHAFSWIVARVRSRACKTIDEFGWVEMLGLFQELNELGAASFLLSDGIDLLAYRDASATMPLHWCRLVPPHETTRLVGRTFAIDYDSPMDVSRTLLVFSTLPMRGGRWTPMEPGELRVVRRGASVWSSHPSGMEEHVFAFLGSSRDARIPDSTTSHLAGEQQQHAFAPLLQKEELREPEHALLSVVHETRYRYEHPVERSSHRFCLHPVGDQRQEILEHSLEISVEGLSRDFEDVFGNRATILEVTAPFQEMTITSRSVLRVEGVMPSHLKSPLRRDQIPLVWMPWQRQMMQAYLMPPELPEAELRELSEFAMSFVERNDYDLVETLLDLNRTIYRDFVYVPGSTTIQTTPFQVYVQRRGVCQDFANVLICLARLLGVPARYRVGYIYTGGSYENKIQSDASHAWAEVYLPWMGWFGFDPTNGCLAGSDHVRVACGRQFRDAAPTTGTIYRGGGLETLEVGVRVERLEDEESAPNAFSNTSDRAEIETEGDSS